MEITLSLVTDLVAQQFPQWAHLPIKPVELSGHDNRTFRLGEKMSARLPSAEGYAPQVQKEQKWLPLLAPFLSFIIPEPLAIGRPSTNYPWNWSIYRWIEGESINTVFVDDSQLNSIASDLAQFLSELHKINISGGPLAGPHNFHRGAHPSVYDTETRSAITELRDLIDIDAATSVWEKAINSKWDKKPVWIHGDFSTGNMLVKNGCLTAVIDFGCMGLGDPACDLVIAWILFRNKSRKIFKSHVNLDPDTWARARGWALWKALITVASLKDKASSEAVKQLHIISELLNDSD